MRSSIRKEKGQAEAKRSDQAKRSQVQANEKSIEAQSEDSSRSRDGKRRGKHRRKHQAKQHKLITKPESNLKTGSSIKRSSGQNRQADHDKPTQATTRAARSSTTLLTRLARRLTSRTPKLWPGSGNKSSKALDSEALADRAAARSRPPGAPGRRSPPRSAPPEDRAARCERHESDVAPFSSPCNRRNRAAFRSDILWTHRATGGPTARARWGRPPPAENTLKPALYDAVHRPESGSGHTFLQVPP